MATPRALGHDGGAYLLAICVLLVLSGLGIVVCEIGLLERRLGSTEGERFRALAAADSGLAISIARLLEGTAPQPRVVGLGQSAGAAGGSAWLRETRVSIDEPRLVLREPCEVCAADGAWVRVSYRLGATGERVIRSSEPES